MNRENTTFDGAHRAMGGRSCAQRCAQIVGRARAIALILLAAIASGCISSTRIYSRPAGATVVLDKERILGRTPLELRDQVWVWTRHELTLTLDGHKTQTAQVKSTGMNPGYVVACVCTAGILLPMAFLSTYSKMMVVDLLPLAPQTGPAALPDAPVSFE